MGRRKQRSRAGQRDLSTRSLDALLSLPVSPVRVTFDMPTASVAEDRRHWRPEPLPLRPPLTLRGTVARTTVVDRRRLPGAKPFRFDSPFLGSQTKAAIAFEAPKRVAVCVRRHQRREVLFALKRTGAGAASRKRRRSSHSDVRC